MQTADYNPDDFSANGMQEADKSLLVKFFFKPREDKAATLAEGRPIFKDVEYIDIKIAGNRHSGASRPATPEDKQRFPNHYAAFKQRTEVDLDMGTPLLEWGPLTRSRCEELAFFHVKTVEQLANMADTQVGQFMGLTHVREQARKYLAKTESEKPFLEMEQKYEEMQAKNAELALTLERLMEQVNNPNPDLTDKQRERQIKRTTDRAKRKMKD